MCVCLPMNVYIHTYHTNTSTNTMLLVKLAKSHNFMSLPSSHEDVQPIPSPVGRFPNIPQILMIRLCQVRLLRASCLVSPVLDCTQTRESRGTSCTRQPQANFQSEQQRVHSMQSREEFNPGGKISGYGLPFQVNASVASCTERT